MFWDGVAGGREHLRSCVSRYFKHENICSRQKLLITYLNGLCLFGDVTVLVFVLTTRRTSKTFSQSVRKDEKLLCVFSVTLIVTFYTFIYNLEHSDDL